MTQIDGEIYHVHGSEESFSENEYTTKAIYRFNANSIKLPMVFFRKLEQIISHFVCMEKKQKKKKLK